jgi:hypothetical protein
MPAVDNVRSQIGVRSENGFAESVDGRFNASELEKGCGLFLLVNATLDNSTVKLRQAVPSFRPNPRNLSV